MGRMATQRISFDPTTICFDVGVNILQGSVDSAAWAISYVLSMYNSKSEEFVLHAENSDIDMQIENIKKIVSKACYLDPICQLYSKTETVEKIVEKALKKQNSDISSKEICELFHIYEGRFQRPLNAVGNELFRCMAAIGYANGRDVFCFPWISKKLVTYYIRNILDVLEILCNLNKIVLFPTDFPFTDAENSFPKKIYSFDENRYFLAYDFLRKW